jgi:hypothetical protein
MAQQECDGSAAMVVLLAGVLLRRGWLRALLAAKSCYDAINAVNLKEIVYA